MGARTDLIKAFFERYMASDVSGRMDICREQMAEDYVCIEPPELPQGGIFRGWDAGPKISRIYNELWDIEILDMKMFEDGDEDVVVMRTVYRWTSKVTHKSIDEPVVEIVKFSNDNKFQSFEVFHFDPAGLLATLPGRH